MKTDENTREFWAEEPYGFYLNAVDDLLVKLLVKSISVDCQRFGIG